MKTSVPLSQASVNQVHVRRATILTVIIPVYNEAQTLERLVRKVLDADPPKQVIVVDDGSTDDTPRILSALRTRYGIEVHSHSSNRGKGASIRTGLKYAEGEYTIIQDGDMEYDPAEFGKLLKPLLANEATVVYGSRYLVRPKEFKERWRFLRFGVSVLNVAVRILYKVRLTDVYTCYKMFPTEMVKKLDLQSERFELCAELTSKLIREGIKITEVPISYHSRRKADGKKIRLRDGWEALTTFWRWRHWQPVKNVPKDKSVKWRIDR